MHVALDGPLPLWLGECSDEVLRARFGSATYERGRALTAASAVLTVTVRQDGRQILAQVRGSSGRDYRTTVVARDHAAGAAPSWTGVCSCPMQVECKHVAAVILTVRRAVVRAEPRAPSWEARLADVVRRTPENPPRAPLGLLLEPVTSGSPRPHPGALPRIRLRPVTLGASGRWVRTGASWRELENPYRMSSPWPPEQQAVLQRLLTTYRAGQPYWASHGDATVHLDDLGTACWGLLADARTSGISLLRDKRESAQVELSPPAAVRLDLRRPAPTADVTLTVVVDAPEGVVVPDAPLVPVGSPAHGVVVDGRDRLLLVPFGKALDAATHGLFAGGPVVIPAPELPTFFGRYHRILQQRIDVVSGDGSVDLPDVQPPHLCLDVVFEPGHRAVVRWAYGYPVDAQVERVRPGAHDGSFPRDLAGEATLVAGLSGLPSVPGLAVDAGGGLRLLPETELVGLPTALFAADVLPVLQQRDEVTVTVTGSPVDYARTDEAPLISISTHDSGDGDWFDLAVQVSVAGQQVPLGPLIAALTTEQPQLILNSGTWFRLDRPELASLRRLVEEARSLQDRDSTGLRLSPWQAGLWEELVGLGVVAHQSERWRATAGALLTLDTLPRPDPPTGLLATLRPYQLEGYHWLSLLWDHQLGGILADDMGLGKTLQTLAMAVRALEQGTLGGDAGPLLIVAPTSVVGTWASEAEKFCPGLRVRTVTETQARRGRPLSELAADADLVITSYTLMRIEDEDYVDLAWSGVVLDEAQFVKNHQAKTYQSARRIPAPFKLAITGTPLENSLMDLWSMLSITAPGLFPNPQRFTELYRKPIESGQSPERLATLRRRIRPLMMRRTKDQVAADLPPKIEQILHVPLNPAHRRIYDKHLQRERQRVLGLLDDVNRNRIAILRSLTVMRQLSLDASLVDDAHAGKVRSSKIDVLLDQLREVVDEGHRVLVFSQFTGFLALVRTRLSEEGIAHCYLDGRTRNRSARIAEFTQGDAPVFVISLKAGGVGLTLTEADYVFVLDPWWNPATEAQAVDRTHRIGQTKTVMVYRLIASDTIEEKVLALQDRKRDLFQRVVDGDDGAIGSALTADDIRALLE